MSEWRCGRLVCANSSTALSGRKPGVPSLVFWGGAWSDFVFAPDYELMPLDEVERFVGENGHLPDVPSEAEVRSDGYSQHEMNKALLRKIEELTLHVIRQQKEIEALRQELIRDKQK